MDHRTLVDSAILAASLGLLVFFVLIRNEQPTPGAAVENSEAFGQQEPSIQPDAQFPADEPANARRAGLPGPMTTIEQNPIATPGNSGSVDKPVAERSNETRTAAESNARTASDDSEAAPAVLGQQVRDVIEEVQIRQLDGQWEEALNEMNALYQDFDALNSFEQATLLNFYTNTLLQLEMWQESISAFSQMLTIPELRPDINARALIALGQLHNRVGEPESAIAYYERALAFTSVMDNMEEQSRRVERLLTEVREATAN